MDFFQQYFLEPIESGAGYNIVNTAAYAIALTLSLFVLVWLLKRLGIKLDRRLWTDMLPFVLLGGILRALEDVAFFPQTWLLITPGIYLLIFGVAFAGILADRYVKKGVTRYLGLSLLAIFGFAVLLNVKNWLALALILAMASVLFVLVFKALQKTRLALKGKNWQVLFAHALDACASFSAVTFLCTGGAKYSEQHVIPSLLFSELGAWLFIPLKIAIVLLALYVIDREASREWNWMFKFAILVVGLGPATRNLLTVFMNSAFC
jgi:uncharacterized membrane protein